MLGEGSSSSGTLEHVRTYMVIGLGSDLIEIARVADSIERFGTRFLHRVFTPDEIAYCQRKRNSAESFAARFAAKEAGAKALGTGISHGVAWPEIEVRREASGKPTLFWHGRARERARQLGVRYAAVTLSHSRDMALAVVVLED
jgi:holo-[acyl-carrier protein] synthase